MKRKRAPRRSPAKRSMTLKVKRARRMRGLR